MSALAGAAHRARILNQFFGFLWRQKQWWMIPMFAVAVLFGVLLLVAQSTALGPFIYTLF